MSKDNDKKTVYNQMAWILNYKPQIGQQHIHMGNQADEEEPVGEDVAFEEEDEKEKIDPVVAFVKRVKEIMLKAEKDNGKQKQNNSRSYTTTYIYNVDGKGFGKVMDELLANYEHVIKDYLDGATAETAVSIKYVAPFIGYVLDTHLYSAAKMPKNEFKDVFETVYGKGTSAVSKMSDKNPSSEAEVLYKTAKEIMEKHKNG